MYLTSHPVNTFDTPPRRAGAPAPRRRSLLRLGGIADRFGATASFLCAVHCALLPFVIAVLPAVGLGFLADHGIERGFVLFACSLALFTIGLSYRRHRSKRALIFLMPGIALLLAGVMVDFDRYTSLHAWLVSSGGTLVAFAHFINLRLSHVHNAACGH